MRDVGWGSFGGEGMGEVWIGCIAGKDKAAAAFYLTSVHTVNM